MQSVDGMNEKVFWREAGQHQEEAADDGARQMVPDYGDDFSAAACSSLAHQIAPMSINRN